MVAVFNSDAKSLPTASAHAGFITGLLLYHRFLARANDAASVGQGPKSPA